MTKRSKIEFHTAVGIITLIYWLTIYLTKSTESQLNYWYQAFMVITPIAGGIFGIDTARHWSGMKSKVGQGLIFLSLGMIAWGLGQAMWAVYTIINSGDVPTSNIMSLLYLLSWPLWTIGIIKLSRMTGAKYALKQTWGKVAIVLIPTIVLAISYYLLITVARGGKIDNSGNFWDNFFNLSYPVGDVIILTVAAVVFGLSWRYLGGRFKLPIIVILTGYVLNYIADFAFAYTTGNNTYYNGHWVDLAYPIVFTILAIGLAMLDPTGHTKKLMANSSPNSNGTTKSNQLIYDQILPKHSMLPAHHEPEMLPEHGTPDLSLQPKEVDNAL